MRSIQQARRIVVKVGTSTLTHATGKINLRRVDRLAAVLADLQNAGREVALVSSGAIGVGAGKLGLAERPRDTRGKQAAAAVGQCELMFLYSKLFGAYGKVVAQLLLTREDVDSPKRRDNLLNTFAKLFEYGAIPIINENDSVSTDEIEAGQTVSHISFGENDALSAIVAKLVGAEALVFLTDIDGLCTGNPAEDDEAVLLPVVNRVTDDIFALAGPSGTARGSGGMLTKLQAAKEATEAGIDTVILNGTQPENLYQLFDGRQIGTWFKRQ